MDVYTKILQNHYEPKISWAENKKLYRDQMSECAKKFEDDLAEEFGVEDNPKKELLFSIAWEKGHANGLTEVYNEYAELYRLIK